MNRRKFLRSSSSLALAGIVRQSAFAQSEPTSATLTLLPGKTGALMPKDFVGLSYESQQLSDPNFFSASNTALIPFFRTLSRSGVLRLGGNTSANSWWKATPGAAAPVFKDYRNAGDGVPAAKLQYAITPAAIGNLHEFLGKTGWSCIYGLNLANGTPQAAADEAAYVAGVLGGSLLYFQLGNEPDLFSRGVRHKDWTAEQYFTEWLTFARAIQKRVPGALFSAPDVSNRTEWISGFARQLSATPDAPRVSAITHHYYAGGPPSDPALTIARLMSIAPRVARDAAIVVDAAQQVHARYRMTEGNTCYNGGKPGLSDVFASTLWAADYSLKLAALGYAGINLHGGGGRQVADSLGGKLPGEALLPPNAGWHPTPFYTPIASAQDGGFMAQPVYYGLLLMDHFAGCTLLDTTTSESLPAVSIYAARGNGPDARSGNATRIAIINKSPTEDIVLKISCGSGLKLQRISADGLDAKEVRIGERSVQRNGILEDASAERVDSRAGITVVAVPRASAALAYLV